MATPQQVRRRGRWSLILGTIVAAVLFAAVAYADNVQNDVVAGSSDTITAGGSTVVDYRIAANSGDGESGCNATAASPATVTINAPAGVAANPGSLSFTSCGTEKPVTFSSSTPGNYSVTVSVSDSGAGSYNTNPAAFTLHVNAPPDTTAPNISYVLDPATPDGTNGWYRSNVSLTWSVTDGESAVSKTGCVDQNVTADQAETTYSCSATSAGGSAGPVSVAIKRDGTNPTIGGSRSPAANGNGWNNTDVAVSFECDDNLSGVASCGPDTTLSAEAAGQSAVGNATDNAGNTASTTVSNINIDKTDPVATATAAPAANANGWNNTSVVVSFTATDAGGSGVDTCSADVTLGDEGAGQSASGECADKAGNSASAAKSNIDIDKTKPTVALVGGPANGSSYYFGSVPAAPTCTASDALSGLDGACAVAGYGTSVGSHTVTATVKDKAGNVDTASFTYSVLAWTLSGFFQPIDMGSTVFNTVKSGSTVPLKFRVFAGSTELTEVSAVKSLSYVKVTCAGVAIEDAIEEIAPTGGTLLRYDSTGGQFVYNLKTSGKAGDCYRATMTTQDGSKVEANFKLK
jgi:hypothetical protein